MNKSASRPGACVEEQGMAMGKRKRDEFIPRNIYNGNLVVIISASRSAALPFIQMEIIETAKRLVDVMRRPRFGLSG